MEQSSEKSIVKTIVCVLLWFFFNISMAIVSKWLYTHGAVCTDGLDCRKFEFPLTMTSFDIAVGWFLSALYLRIWLPGRPRMSLDRQLSEIAPLATCFALSVGMGNLSLKYIYPSFNQMIGASSPLITVTMAWFMGTRYNAWTWASMPVICGGLCVCVTEELNFHLLGALSCIGAAILRGVKSIIQQRLLSGKLDPVELLFYMSPYAATVLYMCALAIEGVDPVLLILWKPLSGVPTTGQSWVWLLLFLTAFNAWFLSIANFLVTSYTNAVTLQVLGNVKTCLSIMVSVTVFGNPLQTSQCFGVASCLFGVWLYGYRGKAIKPRKQKDEA